MKSWLDQWALHHRPLLGFWNNLEALHHWRYAVDNAPAEHRRKVLIQNCTNYRGLAAEREESYRTTADHYEAMATLWNQDTSDVVTRFRTMAKGQARERARLDALLVRVNRDALPSEILTYRPLA